MNIPFYLTMSVLFVPQIYLDLKMSCHGSLRCLCGSPCSFFLAYFCFLFPWRHAISSCATLPALVEVVLTYLYVGIS